MSFCETVPIGSLGTQADLHSVFVPANRKKVRLNSSKETEEPDSKERTWKQVRRHSGVERHRRTQRRCDIFDSIQQTEHPATMYANLQHCTEPRMCTLAFACDHICETTNHHSTTNNSTKIIATYSIATANRFQYPNRE